MKCPLCAQSVSVLLRSYQVEDLSALWVKSFGFDPFIEMKPASMIAKRQCKECGLIFFDPPYYGDGKFYRKLSKSPLYYEPNKWEFDVAANLVAEIRPKSLLEIGCGNGSFLEKISSLVDRIEGVDINKSAVEQCVQKEIPASTKSIKDLEESYEIIASFQVLEHMDNLSETVHDMVNSLLSGGYLILAVPNPDGYLKDIDINLLDMPPHHNSSWPKQTFDYLASLHGLEITGYYKEPLRYVHYLGYLGNIMAEHRKMMIPGVKKKLFSFVQSVFINIFAPFTYIQHREGIIGQTHLVVLKKQ